MSALQSDLFGLMGEGDIQCRGRDSPNLCRIEAVCEQKAAQAPELFQFIALHGGAKITKLVERGYFSAQHQYYNIFYLVRFLPDMFTVPYNLLYSWAFIWLSESLILLNPGLLLVLYSFSYLLTLKKVLFAGYVLVVKEGLRTKFKSAVLLTEWAELNQYAQVQQWVAAVMTLPSFAAKAWLSAITFLRSGLYRVPSGKMTRYIYEEKKHMKSKTVF